MAKFTVTGGPAGDQGISVGSRRYEAGDTVEMTAAKAEWLVERGLLVASGRKSDPIPDPEPVAEEPSEAPEIVSEAPDEDNNPDTQEIPETEGEPF